MKANTTNLSWLRLTNKPWDASNIWEADAGIYSTKFKKLNKQQQEEKKEKPKQTPNLPSL